MFTSILFLILALLLISFVPETVTPWIDSKWIAFTVSILLFICLLGFICLQHRLLKKFFKRQPSAWLIIVNMELLTYLIIYQYVLDAGRIFTTFPSLENLQILNATWELALYLIGLGITYSLNYLYSYPYGNYEARYYYAIRQLRLLIPFIFPFFFLTLFLDIFNLTVGPYVSLQAFEWISLIFSILLVISLLIFLPYFIQKIWKCHPLPSGELKDRLTKICQRAHFKHAGMKTWSIMHDQLTAGIIGVIPCFRYVMFTDRLLQELPPESIEAILVHEIGHNARRHLLIYPFILAGMVVSASLILYLFSDSLMNLLEQTDPKHPSKFWSLFNPLIFFTLYALIVIIYFRFVFGYFSRIFERQADLHVFDVGMPPQHMIEALKAVAYTSGGYDTPNWHHYSIKERVEFLQACITDPRLIQRHHYKAKISVFIYFVAFILAIFFLIYNTFTFQ